MEIITRVRHTFENCTNIGQAQKNLLRELDDTEKSKEVRQMILVRVTLDWALAYYKRTIESRWAQELTVEDVIFREDIVREVFAILLSTNEWKEFFSAPAWRMVRDEYVVAGAQGVRESSERLFEREVSQSIESVLANWGEKSGDYASAQLGQLFCHTVTTIKMRHEEIGGLISDIVLNSRQLSEMSVEQEQLIHTRHLHDYLERHVKNDHDHMFQLLHALMVPRREAVMLETVLLILEVAAKCQGPHRIIFLQKLSSYIIDRFNQYEKEKDYLERAVEFRKKLVHILGSHELTPGIVNTFDMVIAEQMPAYLDNFWSEGDGYAFLLQLARCHSIELFGMRANIEEVIGKRYDEVTQALDKQITNIIQNNPAKFLDYMFGIFRTVVIHKGLVAWMETTVKNHIARFAQKANLTINKQNTLVTMHAKAMQVYSPMLPVELQPGFERLIHLSRAQFLMNDIYSEEKITPEGVKGAKFRVM